MASLDDIPKNKFFRAPERYFETLPGQIQARISKPEEERAVPGWRLGVVYALPMLIVLCILYFFTSATPSAEAILATVETQEMIDYLQESVMTTDDVLETLDWSADELESIENEIYDVALPDADSVHLDL